MQRATVSEGEGVLGYMCKFMNVKNKRLREKCVFLGQSHGTEKCCVAHYRSVMSDRRCHSQ